ncbi:MAG: ABC transporter ATP-binding protein, partial [bacterium]
MDSRREKSLRRAAKERELEHQQGINRFFFARPFLVYLRPFRLRLVLAFAAMFSVGFFGSVNLLVLKPAIDVIFGLVQPGEEDHSRSQTRAAGEVSAGPEETSWLANMKAHGDALIAPARAKARQIRDRFEVYAAAHPFPALRWIALILVTFVVLKGVSEYIAQYNLSYALYQSTLRVKEDIFRHVIRRDLSFFTAQPTGVLISRITSDITAIKHLFELLIKDIIQQPITVFFLVLVLLTLDFKLTIVSLIILPFALLPLIYFAKVLRRVTRKSKRKADELSSVMTEALMNIRIVKCFNTEDLESRKFVNQNQKLFYYYMKRRIAKFASSPIMEVLGSISVAGILMLGGWLILERHQMKPSIFMVYLVTLSRFYAPLKQLSRINQDWQIGRVSVERILQMLALEDEIKEAPNALPLPRIERGIELKNVKFAYKEKEILDNISFRARLGQTIAIVGKSGSGKTTLVNLLPRFFDINGGSIEIDGADLRNYRIRDL